MVVVQERASLPSWSIWLNRRSVVALAVIALLVVSAVWWEFNPRILGVGGYEVGFDRGEIGRAVYFDAGVRNESHSNRTIDVRSVRPVIVTNTAAASVGVLLCHNPPTDTDQLGVASDLAYSCTSVSAFRPAPIALSGLGLQIILAVTPNARGTIRISSVDVTYRDGIRRGHQRAGGNVVVTVP